MADEKKETKKDDAEEYVKLRLKKHFDMVAKTKTEEAAKGGNK